MSSVPLVSVAMPVYNGERYLRAAIDSILGQSLSDLELVICDNASTDSTSEICRQYAAKDSRVRYFRNPKNLGPGANYNLCVINSTGKHFRWHAHDDLCHPDYNRKCVEVLERDPSISNCHSLTMVIDEAGEDVEEYHFPMGTHAENASTRFARLILASHRCHKNYEIFGLMRREQVLTWMPQGCFAHADRLFTVQMALLGRFYEVPERLFLARRHVAQSMQYAVKGTPAQRMLGRGPLPPTEWWNPARKGKSDFPEWRLLGKYTRTIAVAPIGPAERTKSAWHLSRWTVRRVPKLFRDVVLAAESLVIPSRGTNKVIGPHRPAPQSSPEKIMGLTAAGKRPTAP